MGENGIVVRDPYWDVWWWDDVMSRIASKGACGIVDGGRKKLVINWYLLKPDDGKTEIHFATLFIFVWNSP